MNHSALVQQFTVVSFHAHPDDEALLTGGTLARAAAEGHRVVLVTATAGEAGLTASSLQAELADRRMAELRSSAAALGCARVELLGFADSGADGTAAAGGFAAVDPDAPARRLADILLAERAHVLTVYDAAGGYGHPDHRQVHRVGIRAAALARTPVVLEATVDRRLLRRVAWIAARVPGVPADFAPDRFDRAFSEPGAITHRVRVRRQARAKRAAMAAHRSQSVADEGLRTLRVFLRLPAPLFGVVFGREWFTERGRRPGADRLDDIFASLRAP